MIVASYIAVDQSIIDSFIDIIDNRDSEEEVFEQVEDLLNYEDAEILELDRLWDVLHFVLTGRSALSPDYTNPLSHSLLGFSRSDTDELISIIEPSQVNDILKALQSIDFNTSLNTLDVIRLKELKIYPNMWDKVDLNDLKEELRITFEDLLIFYEGVVEHELGVLITIL